MNHTMLTKGHKEKPRSELDKNATCRFQQIPEAAPHKTATVRPLSFHLVEHPSKTNRHASHSWRSKYELRSDVLLWTQTHGRASVGRPSSIY